MFDFRSKAGSRYRKMLDRVFDNYENRKNTLDGMRGTSITPAPRATVAATNPPSSALATK